MPTKPDKDSDKYIECIKVLGSTKCNESFIGISSMIKQNLLKTSGKPVIMIGGNFCYKKTLTEPIERGIPYLLLNTRKFSTEPPKNFNDAFTNIKEYVTEL